MESLDQEFLRFDLFMGNLQIKYDLLGPCYCKDKQGEPDKNDIMCIRDTVWERLDPCHYDQWCIGPNTRNKAQMFSEKNFCSEGVSIV